MLRPSALLSSIKLLYPITRTYNEIPAHMGAMASSVFGFFGLRENPFSINPNPRFLYPTPLTQAASQQLVDGIRNRKGLILLTGEVGTGKTLLLRRLLDWLAEQKMPKALIFNSHVNPDHLLDFTLSDFGVPWESSLKSDKLISLNRWLLDRHRLGQTPVLIVDEAQGLPLQALEEIRLLLNLETPREKLLQVILAGQPELEEKLKRHELQQLRQRITVRCRTAPFTLQETQACIEQRLRTAGAKESIFQPEAAAFVHAYSQGIPRVVNLLCEHSLINACAGGSRVVAPQFVERAAQDCQLEQVDAVSRVLNSSYPAGASLGEIGSIFGGMSLSDFAPSGASYSTNASVLTHIPPAAIHSEADVPMSDSCSGAAAMVLEEPLPQVSDLRAADPMVPTDPALMISSVAQMGQTDKVREQHNSLTNAAQPQPSRPSSPVRTPPRGPSISPATTSLFQAWWRSFSADACSTWRQLNSLLRTQFFKMRPYAFQILKLRRWLREPLTTQPSRKLKDNALAHRRRVQR
jgi:type II secretory pathway predicted ATPase ExeA